MGLFNQFGCNKGRGKWSPGVRLVTTHVHIVVFGMVTLNLGQNCKNVMSRKMVEDITKDISGLTLSTLSVPRPRNLHWSPQSNRVYISAGNNFHESPKQLKSGARLRLGDDEASSSRNRNKKINFKSNSMKPIASINSSRNVDRNDRQNKSSVANKEKAESMKGEEDRLICDICQVQSSSKISWIGIENFAMKSPIRRVIIRRAGFGAT